MGLARQSAKNQHGGGKKTRNLGKWVDGFSGILTKKYKALRKKKMKTARRSRAVNAAKRK